MEMRKFVEVVEQEVPVLVQERMECFLVQSAAPFQVLNTTT